MDLPMLNQLREQTRPAHLALESQPALLNLLSSHLTERDYGQLLQAMLAFYQSLEPELVPAAAALLARHPDPDYQYLPRSPVLASDCRTLGLVSSGFRHPPLELRLDNSASRLLGILYVIEGSTQGGRIIGKHLAATLDLDEDSGARFFNLYQQDNSWMAFRRWMERDLAYNYRHEIEYVIEGADMTFAALQIHLDRWQALNNE